MKKSGNIDTIVDILKSGSSLNGSPKVEIYLNSVRSSEDGLVFMVKGADAKHIAVVSGRRTGIIRKFKGTLFDGPGLCMRLCPLSEENASSLRKLFPWTAPVSLRKARTTIGCGDRLGLASAGHIAAISGYQASPVLAQQSMRELSLTGRTYRKVVDDAVFLVFQSGHSSGYGADGDHLKNIRDIDTAVDAGMPMITLDLSEVMLAAAGSWSDTEVRAEYLKLPNELRSLAEKTYEDRIFSVGDGRSIRIDGKTARRCAVMYLEAIGFAEEVYRHLKRRRGDEFDLEISIDETSAPTLPEHHLFIASELLRRKMAVNSVAPRFIGEFQKGIDYIGDMKEFAAQFKDHCRIAETFGGYKISVHSGSDKFKVFPVVGRETGMRFHLKTAGTSWLEAVRAMAVAEPSLYRKMHRQALESYPDATKLYHVTKDVTKVPDIRKMPDCRLPELLEMDEARQLLHITYGGILNAPSIRGEFLAAMHRHEDVYNELILKHFRRHLDSLGVPGAARRRGAR